MSSSIKSLPELSSLPSRWARVAHPMSLWGRQLAWGCGVWSGWLLVTHQSLGYLVLAVAIFLVMYSFWLSPRYTDDWFAHISAQIILGEYVLAMQYMVPNRSWWRTWWFSKGMELIALGLLAYGLFVSTGGIVFAAAAWWQAIRWWQRYQLVGLARWYTTAI